MARARILSLALLAACSSDLSGDWYGTCAFSDSSYGYSGALGINVANGKGQRIDGTVKLDMPDDRSFTGEMTGLRSDSYVEMDATVTAGAADTYFFDLTGELQDDGSLEGTCVLSPNEQGAAGLTGGVVLEQP